MSLSLLASPASTALLYEDNHSDTHDPSVPGTLLPDTFSGYSSGNLADTSNRHDKNPTLSTNYLACDGHIKYLKIPYVANYDVEWAKGVTTSNLGSYVVTFSYT